MGLRRLSSYIRSGSKRLPRDFARPRRWPRPSGCSRRDKSECGALPGWRRYRQQLRRFPVAARYVLPAGSAAGATNIKVAGVADFAAGQTITVDTGANLETAVIATVGTPGATTVDAAISVGATVIPVANAVGFAAGQTISIDSGANQQTAVVVSTAGGRGGATITVTAPITLGHVAGAVVSGTGITLTGALNKAHASGAQVVSGAPSPGAPNQYYRSGH